MTRRGTSDMLEVRATIQKDIERWINGPS